jgi:hypothetical protein
MLFPFPLNFLSDIEDILNKLDCGHVTARLLEVTGSILNVFNDVFGFTNNFLNASDEFKDDDCES